MKKKIEALGKRKAVILVCSTVLVLGLVGGGSVYAYNTNQYQKKVSQAEAEQKDSETKLVNLEKSINDLYLEDDHEFLMTDLNNEELQARQKELSSVSFNNLEGIKEDEKPLFKTDKDLQATYNDLQDELATIEKKLGTQTTLNLLFKDKEAINGDKINKDLVIVEDVDQTTFKKEILSVFFVKKEKDSELGKWQEGINAILTNADTQLTDINTATELTNKLFEKEKVSDKANRDGYKKAAEAVKKVKNEKAKKALEDKLKKVDEAITKKEKEAAEKKAKASGGEVVQKEDGSFDVQPVDQVASSNGETTSGNYQEGTNNTNTGNGGYVAPQQSVPNTNSGTSNGGNYGNGGNATPPATGGGNQAPAPTPTPAPPVVDNSPINLGNSGIFASTHAEADAQASASYISQGYFDYVVRPAINANGDIVGYTADFS